ncbi:hypothetical protein P168DRAFT_38887 [Aspergillus campestris IBT 28561]|uniref:Uncharacterized protein n=1 Tax=Aspergillus campestris (strain IBT 28561) TaxID=1392248 RepID=A0A2I1CWG4_ASPC2|nr:uncharacterized protein P168DRAFT_38887 [Aspergillus campestris IBT 28561]PKY01964.1 hypothetical protein P168DRAFT_38887 [Aspergillus campestris IBT 28561]
METRRRDITPLSRNIWVLGLSLCLMLANFTKNEKRSKGSLSLRRGDYRLKTACESRAVDLTHSAFQLHEPVIWWLCNSPCRRGHRTARL